VASLRARDVVAVEPALRRLDVPTLIVWGTADGNFPMRWARWLRDNIPGAVRGSAVDTSQEATDG